MKLGQAVAAVLFTSLATIGSKMDADGNVISTSGQGYRVAAIVCAVLCVIAAVALNFYREKKVMATLESGEIQK